MLCCSAGIGRTGTFIALDSLLDQAKAERKVEVYRFVNSMRGERMEMVQTQASSTCLLHILIAVSSVLLGFAVMDELKFVQNIVNNK